jgi:hypothetical protein
MKKIFSVLLVMGLLLTVAVWNVYADDATTTTTTTTTTAAAATRVVNFTGITGDGVFTGGFLGSAVHEQAYLTYLVKEYSPESLANWQEAFAARNEAIKAAKENAQTSVPSKDAIFEAEKIADKPVAITIKGLDNGDPLPGTDIQGDKAQVITIIGKEVSAETKAELQAKTELYQKFENAVANSDAAAIKAVLPDLLTDYNKNTEQLKNMKIFIQNKLGPEEKNGQEGE